MVIKTANGQEDDDLEPLEELSIEDMYDDSPEPGIEGLYGLVVREGLTQHEKDLTPLYAKLSRGLMLVSGKPGSGKGTFTIHLSWRLRRMFEEKKVLLDFKPRPLFDYGYEDNRFLLFGADFMMNEIGKMAEKAGTKILNKDGSCEQSKKFTKKSLLENTKALAKQWKDEHEVLLRNGVWVMDEFKDYLHNRNPFNPVGIQVAKIIAVWRHLDLLILGMCPNMAEIDAISCLPYMTHEVVTSATFGGSRFCCRFYRKQHVTSKGVVATEGKPITVWVDGAKPRPEIAVQIINPDIKGDGVNENRVLDYLKSMPNQLANLNMISDALKFEINELEEFLINLHYSGLVQCKSFFQLFNSKNYANLNPKFRRRAYGDT